MYFSSQILRHNSGDFDDIMLTDVYIFYIFVYTYTCNDMRSVMLQINEYDDDDIDETIHLDVHLTPYVVKQNNSR